MEALRRANCSKAWNEPSCRNRRSIHNSASPLAWRAISCADQSLSNRVEGDPGFPFGIDRLPALGHCILFNTKLASRWRLGKKGFLVTTGLGEAKARQVYLVLRDRILTGVFSSGARLPNEHDLAEAHGVSRVTIRRALAELEHERLIER